MGRFERIRFSVPTIPLWKGLFCFNFLLTEVNSGRIKHAPNCGYHFVSPSPLFVKGNRPISGTRSPAFSVGSPSISTGSPVRICCLPPPGNRGENVTRNGGPQIGACFRVGFWQNGFFADFFLILCATLCYGYIKIVFRI